MNEQPTPDSNQQLPPPGHPGSPFAGPPAPDTFAKKKTGHWGTWIFIICILLAGFIVFRILTGKKPPPPTPPPAYISVTNVVKGDVAVMVEAIASVTPVYTATISPRVDGQILTVNYKEGQMVESNDLLVVIDPKPYEAILTEATGQLGRDKALLEGANVDLKRYKVAYEKKAIPEQTYADQVALVHQDEGTVKFDEGQVQAANVQLAYCYIRAPFSGRVGLRLVDPGNVVHGANTNAIVVVAQLQPIDVVFNVAEDYLPQIEEQLRQQGSSVAPHIDGDTVDKPASIPNSTRTMAVQAWDRADEIKIASGKVLALNNLIDTATGTIRLKAEYDNTNLALFPNQFVNARLIIKTLHDQNLVPTFAIQHNPQGAFVYLVTNMTATTNGMTTNYTAVTMRQVSTGTVDGNTTAITQGLESGETIAVDNFNKLGEGAKVVVGKPGNGPPGGGAGHSPKGSGSHHKKSPESQSSS